MMQLVKKWRILLDFELSDKQITLIIYDNFYSEMLKKLQSIHWDVEPTRITIVEEK